MNSRRLKTFIALSLALIVIVGGAAQVFATPTPPMNMPMPSSTTPAKTATAPAATLTTYTGYLIDAHCGEAGKDDSGKINVKTNPEKHTTACLKINMCMMSGLGISVKQVDGTYKFIKFDAAGTKKADDTIMMMTKRAANNEVTVKGVINGTTLTVSTIQETNTIVAKDYVGYLMDAHCGIAGKDDSGKINVKTNPEKHMTSCLKINMCMTSGLGVSVKQTDGTYKFIKFDASSSKKADTAIMMMTKRTFNNKIAVNGVLSNGIMAINSIKEVK